MVKLNPYLHFKDNAEEAMNFYHSVFGGELRLSKFKEYGIENPADAELIMHGQIEVSDSLTLMGADTPSHMGEYKASSASISLSGGVEDEALLKGYFEKLSAGGTVTVPMDKSPWGDFFGMCVDKYGNEWMVNIAMPRE